jgi:hypothetical protein
MRQNSQRISTKHFYLKRTLLFSILGSGSQLVLAESTKTEKEKHVDSEITRPTEINTTPQDTVQPIPSESPKKLAENPIKEWAFYLSSGALISAREDLTAKGATTGNAYYTGGDDQKNTFFVGTAANYYFHKNFVGMADISWQKMTSKNSSSDSDSVLSFLAGIALTKTYGSLRPWVGLEVGLNNFHYSKTQAIVQGYSVVLGESSSTGFSYSPKVGIDFDFGGVLLGTWASYQSFAFTTPATVSDGTSSGQINIETTVSWVALGARIGTIF